MHRAHRGGSPAGFALCIAAASRTPLSPRPLEPARLPRLVAHGAERLAAGWNHFGRKHVGPVRHHFGVTLRQDGIACPFVADDDEGAESKSATARASPRTATCHPATRPSPADVAPPPPGHAPGLLTLGLVALPALGPRLFDEAMARSLLAQTLAVARRALAGEALPPLASASVAPFGGAPPPSPDGATPQPPAGAPPAPPASAPPVPPASAPPVPPEAMPRPRPYGVSPPSPEPPRGALRARARAAVTSAG